MRFKYTKILILQFTIVCVCFCEEEFQRNSSYQESLGFKNQNSLTSGFNESESIGMNWPNVTNKSGLTTEEVDDNASGFHTLSSKIRKVIQCSPGVGSSSVQLINDTELIKLLQPDPKVIDRDIPGLCVMVLFYSHLCPFSSMAAPHYNALPRVFPDVKIVAINAMMYHLFNTQNGIVGLPSLILFHSGRPVAKFNDTLALMLVKCLLLPPADFVGPVVSNPSKQVDLLLITSWMFILICSGFYFTKSQWFGWIIETIKSN
ncbi:hypothetical protein NQ317_013599 [Molorchus minor]|uniref:Thioredoxin domain-containing protein n=1 Tax=Molorchus minor TaxID=1323400 RepID=A0ABQ9ISH4_9CUCU|nr:hypothetical protein NQ317_013599 [Molorchus minor]